MTRLPAQRLVIGDVIRPLDDVDLLARITAIDRGPRLVRLTCGVASFVRRPFDLVPVVATPRRIPTS